MKNLDTIEAELDASRNALARQQLTAGDEQDPAPFLLWAQALDNGDILVDTVRRIAAEAATYQVLHRQASDQLEDTQRGREALEAENQRLTREVGNLFDLIQELRPGELQRFVQARQQIQQ